jgi:hypothetical protein
MFDICMDVSLQQSGASNQVRPVPWNAVPASWYPISFDRFPRYWYRLPTNPGGSLIYQKQSTSSVKQAPYTQNTQSILFLIRMTAALRRTGKIPTTRRPIGPSSPYLLFLLRQLQNFPNCLSQHPRKHCPFITTAR